MKKRIITLVLALVILFSAVAVPANAAENTAFSVLRDFIKENGEPQAGIYYYSVSYILRENGGPTGTIELSIACDVNSITFITQPRNDELGFFFWVELHSDGTISDAFISYPSGRSGIGGHAEYGSSITAITNTSVLKASQYNEIYGKPGQVDIMVAAPLKTENEIVRRRNQADKMASTLLKTDLEILQVILKQKGKSIADLGFTAYVPGHRHSWDNGNVTCQPTCRAFGEKEFFCSACNSISLEYSQPTGKHTWDKGTVTQQPTCVAAGIRVYTCTVCKSATRDEAVPALGHSWALTEVTAEGDTLHDSTGHYVCTRCEESKESSLCAAEVFTDMPKQSHWAHDAIDWAYFKGLTGGTSYNTFSPNKVVTRGEVVTFLHTIEGKPEVEAENPFEDVKAKDFYYNAVLWAVANGITKGTTETTFSPKNTCTRAEIVMFLWAAAGRPEPENTENRFQDVKANSYFRTAVLWAVENGITGGIDETHFGPKVNCTRAQVMLFLKAAYPILTAEETPEQPEDPTEPTEPEDPTEPTEPAPDPETP